MRRTSHFWVGLCVALAGVPGDSAAQMLACTSGRDAIERRAFSTALSHLTRCLEGEALSMREVAALLHLRATAHAETGDPLAASEDYRRSLGIRPAQIAWDLIPLGIYLRLAGRNEDSLEVLQQALALDEDGPGTGPGVAAYFHYGWTLHEMKRYAEALDAYAKGIAKEPGFEGSYLRRALSHEAMGERGRARADIVKVLEIGRQRGLDPAAAPDEYRSKFLEYGLIAK
jgi:tetratricopeptide (TPR) repeat protein